MSMMPPSAKSTPTSVSAVDGRHAGLWWPAVSAAAGCLLTGLVMALDLWPTWLATGVGAALTTWLVHASVKKILQETRPSDHAADVPLVSQVLPVWKRQIDSARAHSEESTSGILASFSSISDRLDQAIAATQGSAARLSGQGVDDLIERNDEALTQLLAPMRAAIDSRDQVYTTLEPLVASLEDLRQISQQIRQLARRTNMVALNASVEASRAGDKGSGFAVVAQEVRQLALQSGDAASKMMARTADIDKELQAMRVQAAAHDSSDEELKAQADRIARSVIGSLLVSLGEVQQSSQALREAGAAVRDEVEQVLMGFQTQDRLSQILSSVTEDMVRLSEWVAQGGDLGTTQAGEWLARLEASYTMEEQRTHHHGHAAIERQTAIEFF